MASRLLLLCALFALAASTSGVSAADSAPPPGADCSTLVLTMADCLSFVMSGSTTEKPEGKCCSGLKTVLKTDAECLCETFRNSAQLGVSLNMTKAMGLPFACGVSAPAATNCAAVSNGIGAAPAVSPSGISPSSDAVAGAPGAVGFDGNVGAPSPTHAISGSSALIVSMELLVFTSVMVNALF